MISNFGETHFFPPAQAGTGQGDVPLQLPAFDAIIGNPPYLRWQKLDDLDVEYRERLAQVWAEADVGKVQLTDIYVLFFIHALKLLAPGGRIGFVTSSAWLKTEYGVGLQLLLLREARIIAIVGSEAEPFFPQAAINTVVTIVEKPKEPFVHTDDYPLRFVSLKQKLSTVIASAGGDWWAALDHLVGTIETATDPFEDGALLIRIGSRAQEFTKLQSERLTLPWNLPMRARR